MTLSIQSGESLFIPKTRHLNDEQKKEAAKKIAKAKERDIEMVSGIFKNIECQGAGVQFWFKKYEEPPVYYAFEHGERYTVPRMVAEHLNSNTRIKTFEYPKVVWEGKQIPVITPTGKRRDRYLFVEAAGI